LTIVRGANRQGGVDVPGLARLTLLVMVVLTVQAVSLLLVVS